MRVMSRCTVRFTMTSPRPTRGPLSPNPGLGADFLGQKSWPSLKSRGKNPKVRFSTYFAILNTMAGLKFSKNYCGSHYKNCRVWLSDTVPHADASKMPKNHVFGCACFVRGFRADAPLCPVQLECSNILPHSPRSDPLDTSGNRSTLRV